MTRTSPRSNWRVGMWSACRCSGRTSRRLATRARRDDFADAAADRQLAAQPDGRSVLGCRSRCARRGVARQLDAGPGGRGLRAHRIRRAAARGPARSPGACRTELRRLVVRQDVPLHGLEGRLLRGAPGFDDEFRKVHQFVSLPSRPRCRPDSRSFLRSPRATRLASLHSTSQARPLRPPARAHTARVRAGSRDLFPARRLFPVSDLPDVEFARWLTREVGVAAIPVSVFSASPSSERLVRFCFAKGVATLDAAGERLSGLQAFGGTPCSHLRVALVQTELARQDPSAIDAAWRADSGDSLDTPISSCWPRCSRPASAWTPTLAEEMSGPTVGWLREEAAALGCVIAGSLIVRDAGQCFNRLVWARPDGSLEYYDKRHLFRMANEQQHYTAGTRRLVTEIKGWRVCPLDLLRPALPRLESQPQRLRPAAVRRELAAAACVRLGRAAEGPRDREPELRRRRQPDRPRRQRHDLRGRQRGTRLSRPAALQRGRRRSGRDGRARSRIAAAYRSSFPALLDADSDEITG